MYNEKAIKEIRQGKASLKIPKIETGSEFIKANELLKHIWPYDPQLTIHIKSLFHFLNEGVEIYSEGIRLKEVSGYMKFIKTYPYHYMFIGEQQVLDFIDKCHTAIVYRPQCMMFHALMALEFPEAEPYYNNDHVITKIGDDFYDWDGKYDQPTEGFLPFKEFGTNWIFEHHKAIVNQIKETYESGS